jgi:hypothetical protein
MISKCTFMLGVLVALAGCSGADAPPPEEKSSQSSEEEMRIAPGGSGTGYMCFPGGGCVCHVSGPTHPGDDCDRMYQDPQCQGRSGNDKCFDTPSGGTRCYC